jgi:hypothetical protein
MEIARKEGIVMRLETNESVQGFARNQLLQMLSWVLQFHIIAFDCPIWLTSLIFTHGNTAKQLSVAHGSGPNLACPVFRTITCNGLRTVSREDLHRIRVPLNAALSVWWPSG